MYNPVQQRTEYKIRTISIQFTLINIIAEHENKIQISNNKEYLHFKESINNIHFKILDTFTLTLN